VPLGFATVNHVKSAEFRLLDHEVCWCGRVFADITTDRRDVRASAFSRVVPYWSLPGSGRSFTKGVLPAGAAAAYSGWSGDAGQREVTALQQGRVGGGIPRMKLDAHPDFF
jgi:hypothetical protein